MNNLIQNSSEFDSSDLSFFEQPCRSFIFNDVGLWSDDECEVDHEIFDKSFQLSHDEKPLVFKSSTSDTKFGESNTADYVSQLFVNTKPVAYSELQEASQLNDHIGSGSLFKSLSDTQNCRIVSLCRFPISSSVFMISRLKC